jgi:hypothetical protein
VGSSSSLGAANLALVALYFAPVWGRDAIRSLLSPYNGLDDRVHAAAAVYLRRFFDLGLDGLMLAANILGGIKLVIAAAFLAYAVEYGRAAVTCRPVDRATADATLALALAGLAIWVLPALALGDSALVRLCATQMLLIAGAVIVVLVERHVERLTPQSLHAIIAEQDSASPAGHMVGAAAQPVTIRARATERP